MNSLLLDRWSFMAFLKLTRSYNLLIILLTQCLVYYFLINNGQGAISQLLQRDFIILCMATIFIAAAGYIINDYHDIKIDLINKPGRVIIGEVFSRRIALIGYITLCLTGVVMGFYLSLAVGIMNTFAAMLLWVYSVRMKKTALWGNLIIGLLSALTVLLIYIWKPQQSGIGILAYAWFAFIITLIREVIKDIEDMKGDKQYHCKTLPILVGVNKTVKVIQGFIGIMLLTLILSFFLTDNIILRMFAFLVIAELAYLSYRLAFTDTRKGFRMLGRFCKVIMLTGILALLFF